MITRRTKAILTLSGVFVVGVICGVLGLGAIVRSEVRSAHRLRDRGGFHEYFTEQLELTTAQRDSLQGELDWFYGEFAELRTAAEGEFHDLIDSLDGRLVAHLSPEQITRLRKTEQKLRKQLATKRPAPIREDGAVEVDPPAPAPRDSTIGSAPLAPREPSQSKAKSPRLAVTDVDTTSRVDSAAAAPDPGPAFNSFGQNLQSRLDLSDSQLQSIKAIIGSTKKVIRHDIREMRGFPRLQIEVAAKHLRAMDREIVGVLDEKQRVAYEPIRDEVASRIRSQLIRHMQSGKGGRRKHGRSSQTDGAPNTNNQ